MDTLRGFAVGLVILYHAEHLIATNMDGMPGWITDANEAMAPFRMPTLVFVSGMLLPAALSKPVNAYVTGKLRRIGWPYLVWSFIYATLLIATAATAGRSEGLATFARIFYDPPTYLWYLFYLLIFYIAALVLRRVPWLALTVVGVLISLMVQDDHPALGRFCFLFGLFFLGAVAHTHPAQLDRLLMNWWVRAVAVLGTAVTMALAVFGPLVRYQAEFVGGVLCGIAGFILLSRALASTQFGRVLAENGKQSIVYYCTHWLAMLVLFHVLHRAGLDNALVLLAVNLVAGVASGWIMLMAIRRWPLVNWLYEWKPSRRALRV